MPAQMMKPRAATPGFGRSRQHNNATFHNTTAAGRPTEVSHKLRAVELKRARNIYRCPRLYGAATAGALLKAIRRLQPNTTMTARDCYLLLCGLPCHSDPCCRS